MNKRDLEYFKKKLEKEKILLEEELKTIGRVNPANPNEWQPGPVNMDIDTADENEVADKFEEYEENNVILEQLETQMKDVQAALAKMESGAYGICEISGEPIEKERLEANPAARTSIKHMRPPQQV
ncbi:MAG: TraR/DksA C4-type zinc finger protein [Patescibacteria group bacterium]